MGEWLPGYGLIRNWVRGEHRQLRLLESKHYSGIFTYFLGGVGVARGFENFERGDIIPRPPNGFCVRTVGAATAAEAAPGSITSNNFQINWTSAWEFVIILRGPASGTKWSIACFRLSA